MVEFLMRFIGCLRIQQWKLKVFDLNRNSYFRSSMLKAVNGGKYGTFRQKHLRENIIFKICVDKFSFERKVLRGHNCCLELFW